MTMQMRMGQVIILMFALSISQAHAAVYAGNGNSSFGGAIGNGSLTLTDNGTTITGTLTKGGSAGTAFSSVLVIYIDSKPGGFTDTTGFSDDSSGLRRAISGYNSGSRATANFASGFAADYAIAVGVDQNGGLFTLVRGNDLSVDSKIINLSPTDTQTAATYTFRFDWSDIGLTGGSGFKFETTYITASGSRSLEGFETLIGASGFNTVTFGNFDTYGNPVPEPAEWGLIAGMGLLGIGACHTWSQSRPRVLAK